MNRDCDRILFSSWNIEKHGSWIEVAMTGIQMIGAYGQFMGKDTVVKGDGLDAGCFDLPMILADFCQGKRAP